jgi:hypothetical protein
LCELSAQGVRRNEVDERLHAVDLEHRNQLPVARLELRVAVDRDLLELEPELVTQRGDGLAGALAQVAPGGPVQPDEGYG